MNYEELQKKIENGEVTLEYYAPSESQEWWDEENNCFYNRSGQRLRNPEEYNTSAEGYTPFGDE